MTSSLVKLDQNFDHNSAHIRIKESLATTFTEQAANSYDLWIKNELTPDEIDVDRDNGYSEIVKSLRPLYEDFDGLTHINSKTLSTEELSEIAENSDVIDNIQQACSKLNFDTFQLFMCIRSALFNEKITIIRPKTIFELHFSSRISHSQGSKSSADQEKHRKEIEEAKKYLSKQFSTVFDESSNQSLLELFVVGRRENIPDLPSMLYEVYSQWKVHKNITHQQNYRYGATQFVNESKAFDHLTRKVRELIAGGLNLYSKRFSPQVKTTLTIINDSMYDYCKYLSIIGQCISKLINENIAKFPFQLDFWIIPKNTQDIFDNNEDNKSKDSKSGDSFDDADESDYDDDDDDDDESDDDYKSNNISLHQRIKNKINKNSSNGSNSSDANTHRRKNSPYSYNNDNSIFDIKERLAMDNIVCDFIFEVNDNYNKIERELYSALKQKLTNSAFTRLVCILDRRTQYFSFQACSKNDHISHSVGRTGKRYKKSVFGRFGRKRKNTKEFVDVRETQAPPLIKKNPKKLIPNPKNRMYIYQPPGKYGKFDVNYCQEHLFWLSKEYIFPFSKVKNERKGFSHNYGAIHDFNGQMFMLSFCCHTPRDIRLYWYYSSWMIRMDDIFWYILKLWPKYFVSVTAADLERIERQVLNPWALQLTDEIYDLYKKDLLKSEA